MTREDSSLDKTRNKTRIGQGKTREDKNRTRHEQDKTKIGR